MGYRWYDQHKVAPAYEFGFGMSFASFEFTAGAVQDQALCTPSSCSFTVANIGKVPGAEVAQLYLSFPARSVSLVATGRTVLSLRVRSGRHGRHRTTESVSRCLTQSVTDSVF